MDSDGDTDAGISPRELFEHEDVREEVRAGAAVLLGDAGTEKPEFRELRIQLAREVVVAVPSGRVWLDLRARDVACQRLDLALIRRQLEVHRRR